MKVALTIAGSDPTGGAGAQSDLRVFHHFAVYGLSVLAALTAQNTFKVSAVSAVRGDLLEEQLNTLLNDIRPDALKTGLLFSMDAIMTAAKIIRAHDLRNVVIDPVIVSSTGTDLMERGALDIMKKDLLPLARVITPNIAEASALSGVRISDEEDIEEAARALKQFGPEVIVITGGHLPAAKEHETLELIYDGKDFHRIRGKKIKGEYHGTGCAFSAAITALLARGSSVTDAVRQAREFMDKAIKNAHSIGKGMKLLDV